MSKSKAKAALTRSTLTRTRMKSPAITVQGSSSRSIKGVGRRPYASAVAQGQELGTVFQGSPWEFATGEAATVIEVTRRGVAATGIDAMAQRLDLPRGQLLTYANIPLSTAERRIRNKELLSKEETDRLVRIAKATEKAAAVFEDAENAKAWLKRPIPSLGGAIPLSLLDTAEGYDLVMRTLDKIQYGVFA